MTVICVTAIYRIYENTYSDEVWTRLKILSDIIPIHLFCSTQDSHRVATLQNITPIYVEFEDLLTYKCLKDATILPEERNEEKDTKNYMILMNAKPEFLYKAKQHSAADHYVWIDAGIAKIFQHPHIIFHILKTILSIPLRIDKLFIPGCWTKGELMPFVLHCINWRFSGGLVIVPTAFVEQFFLTVMHFNHHLQINMNRIVWEVNTWALVEDSLPIQWAQGDHNENMVFSLIGYQQNHPVNNTVSTT
jgi:hypothetical protein